MVYFNKSHLYCNSNMKVKGRMHCAGIIQTCVILRQVEPQICKANTPFYLSVIHSTEMKTSFAIQTIKVKR